MLSSKPTITYPLPAPQPTHSHLALAFPCTGAYKVCKTKGLSSQ
ncbi:mCG1048062 [Mus musculus]|nr:mCG1048062 [Mus musculus]